MTNKVALITDTHFGVRSDNQSVIDYQRKFYKDVFFPKIDELDIRQIVHLGDLVDRRKYINFNSYSAMTDMFVAPCIERNLNVDIIIGNHDCFYKDTNRLNAPHQLYGSVPGFRIFIDPVEVVSGNLPILYLPWINVGNQKETLSLIESTKAEIVFGHLELQGFEMYKGSVAQVGTLDRKLLDKFDMVLTGHFHHKSTDGTITYLGTPYEMNWADYDDPKGFYIFDLDTRELEFIQNPYKLFVKVFYEDSIISEFADFDKLDYHQCADSYVRVVVKNKDNPQLFDRFMKMIDSLHPLDVMIVEDHLNLNVEEDTDLGDVEDTQTFLQRYADQLTVTENRKQRLKTLFATLYRESQELE